MQGVQARLNRPKGHQTPFEIGKKFTPLLLTTSLDRQDPLHDGITKEGRCELRTALVEAAWAVVKYHRSVKAYFERLAKRIGSKKAIVAVARKLLVTIWHVLTKQEVDREGNVEKLALKLIMWSRKLKSAGR